MNRPSAITVATIAAILFAGAATMAVHSYLKKQASQTFHGVPIATAATDIAIGTRLESAQVKLATWPKESLPPGYCADARSLVGRVAVRPLNAGDVVTEQKLMPQTTTGASIMTYIVPPGHRAVTVAVNEVAGVAGFITPNSRVDVVLTTPRPGAADKEENISKIILQNIPVLASGQITEQKEGKPVVVPTVTLDLPPDEAEKIIVGTKKEKGSLQLLLRNVIDVASVETKGATIAKALGAAGTPVVAPARAERRVREPKKVVVQVAQAKVAPPAPPPSFSVEIIKGGSKSKREFPQE